MSDVVTPLDDVECRMGELASLLSDVADALTYYPQSLVIRGAGQCRKPGATGDEIMLVEVSDWPSSAQIAQLLNEWNVLRHAQPG